MYVKVEGRVATYAVVRMERGLLVLREFGDAGVRPLYETIDNVREAEAPVRVKG